MSCGPWRAAPLSEAHDLSEFSCGKSPLDNWLRGSARRADRQNTARTYVWEDANLAVVAYFAVAPTAVSRVGLPRSASGGASVIPSYLLAKLALDQRLQGQGLGTFLLLDALETICSAARTGAGRLVVVDAIDHAALSFYLAHGFRPLGEGPRAYLPVAAAERVTRNHAESPQV
ncbi:MAG: GNAT family N-acetyltransferase [Bifidobacteriaceae bacterium]|jgi:GNAT superfamily N-acetyltransferase|nr:GNAT family N-acetyltransferase [Bifidobacteriaceae bacterium]